MGRMTGRWALGLLCGLAVAGTLGCSVTSSTDDGGADGTITIHNDSTHVLTGVYIAQADQADWGGNLLPDVLYSNEQITVLVTCDTYDVLVRDDLQRDCVLGNLDLCFSDQVWVIDNYTLRNCGY